MRYAAVLALMLVSSAVVADGSAVQLSLSYSDVGQYTFEKHSYNYAALLQAIRAEYGTQHIASVTVNMGDDTNLNDRLKICHLKLDTGAQVMLTFTINGQQNTLYCP